MSGHCQGIPDGGATGSASEPAAASALFIGKIETVAGSCTLTRSGDNPVQVKPGDPVCQGDIIETAADGKVGIRFIDGTVFNLSDHGRIVLKEFAGGGVSPSALFDVSNGTFAFIAGEMAKAGRLDIDTPFASIRSRNRAGGIGMLSLASLFFTALEDAQAKDPDVSFLDDGQIRFRDLTNEYGVVELALKTFPPRTVFVDDPGETIVLRQVGSSITESYVTNSLAQMLQYQTDQQNVLRTFSLGLSGAAGNGPSGSGTPPPLLPPESPQPINNFIPPPPPILPPNGGPSGSPNSGGGEFIPPPPPPPVPPTITATPVTVNVTDNHATVTFTFSVAPTDFVLADTAATGGTLSDFAKVDATHYTAIFTATPGIQTNNASVSVIANSYHDTNGNVGLGGSTTFTVDTVPPSITIGTIASNNTISASEGANAAGVIISGTASDGVGGTGVDGQTVTVQIL